MSACRLVPPQRASEDVIQPRIRIFCSGTGLIFGDVTELLRPVDVPIRERDIGRSAGFAVSITPIAWRRSPARSAVGDDAESAVPDSVLPGGGVVRAGGERRAGRAAAGAGGAAAVVDGDGAGTGVHAEADDEDRGAGRGGGDGAVPGGAAAAVDGVSAAGDELWAAGGHSAGSGRTVEPG